MVCVWCVRASRSSAQLSLNESSISSLSLLCSYWVQCLFTLCSTPHTQCGVREQYKTWECSNAGVNTYAMHSERLKLQKLLHSLTSYDVKITRESSPSLASCSSAVLIFWSMWPSSACSLEISLCSSTRQVSLFCPSTCFSYTHTHNKSFYPTVISWNQIRSPRSKHFIFLPLYPVEVCTLGTKMSRKTDNNCLHVL